MKKTILLTVVVIALCFALIGCNNVDELFSFDDIDIYAIDQVDVPAGEYTIDYTIEDLNAYIEHLGITVAITAVDQNDVEVTVTDGKIIVEEDKIYTVTITIADTNDNAITKVITVTAVTSSTIIDDDPIILTAPIITGITDGLLSFNSVDNSVSYKIWVNKVAPSVNEDTYHDATTNSYDLTTIIEDVAQYTIKVKAIGDDEEYLDSTYSAAYVYYVSEQLSIPSNLAIDDNGIVSFASVDNAVGYQIKINAVELPNITTLSLDISLYIENEGEYSISVKAIGDGNLYLNSELSEPIVTKTDDPALATYFTYTELGVGQGVMVTGLTPAGFDAISQSRELIIPERIDGNSVTAIGQDAFNNVLGELHGHEVDGVPQVVFMLETVVIPNSVKRIEQDAFAALSTDSLSLSNTLEYIGKGAFMSIWGINELLIPDSVTEIDDSAFLGSSTITKVVIGTNTARIGKTAFAQNERLDTLWFSPSSVLEEIDSGAFEDCWELYQVTLPNSTKYINNDAFNQCYGLHTIDLGLGIELIGDRAFRECTNLSAVSSTATTAPDLDGDIFVGKIPTHLPSQFSSHPHWVQYFED